MLYGKGGKSVYFGKKSVPVARMEHSHAGSLQFINPTMYTFSSGKVSAQYRDKRMFRWFDYIIYDHAAKITPSGPSFGGLEVEAEYEPDIDAKRWMLVYGSRNGTTGMVTRINSLINNAGSVGVGVGFKPASNTSHNTISVYGRRVKERLILTPLFDTEIPIGFTHAWLSRTIVTDVATGKTLCDVEDIWGDDWSEDCLCGGLTTFFRFFIGFGDRVRYAQGSSNVASSNTFKGYFWGAKIYINPYGYDSNVPERALVTSVEPTPYGLYYRIYDIEEICAGSENPSTYRENYMYAPFGGVMDRDVVWHPFE